MRDSISTHTHTHTHTHTAIQTIKGGNSDHEKTQKKALKSESDRKRHLVNFLCGMKTTNVPLMKLKAWTEASWWEDIPTMMDGGGGWGCHHHCREGRRMGDTHRVSRLHSTRGQQGAPAGLCTLESTTTSPPWARGGTFWGPQCRPWDGTVILVNSGTVTLGGLDGK